MANAEGSGRQLSVDQRTGTHYPFIQPTDDIQFLVGDVCLVYADPECGLTPPFRIKQLTGLGPAEGTPTVQIVDAEDEIVFDSDDAILSDVTWAPDKRILEWANVDDRTVCRLVVFTQWSPRQPEYEWPDDFQPVSAVLDPRVLVRRPESVVELIVETADGDFSIKDDTQPIFAPGYNMVITPSANTVVDGGERGASFTFECIPGAGLGKYPGCAPEELVRRLNGVGPSVTGDLAFIAEQCYRTELVVDTIGEDTVSVVPGTVRISTGCTPCATCDQFKAVYEAIRRMRIKFDSIRLRQENAMEQQSANVGRWNTSISCRQATALRLTVAAMPGCRVAVGAALCNTSKEKLQDVSLRITPRGAEGLFPCLVCRSVIRRGNNDVDSPIGPNQWLPYTMTVDGASYIAHFDCIDPGSQGQIAFQLAADGLETGTELCIDLEAIGIEIDSISRCATMTCTNSYSSACCEALETETTTEEP